MDYPSLIKRTKPIPGGNSEEEYRGVMRKIREGLTTENLETVLFLCKDHISHGRQVKTPLEFFKLLEDRDLISQSSADFLAEILHIIRRMDLLKLIPCIKNKKHFENEYLSVSYCHFSNYRVLTVQLQEQLSQRDFHTFRHECAAHLNVGSLDNATNVFQLLRKLEEEDVISNDDYEELIKILRCIENVKPLKLFQRLLDGDESVAVPAGKQTVQRNESHVTYADRTAVQQTPQPMPWPEHIGRVETMPHMMPPPKYESLNGMQTWQTHAHFAEQTAEKSHAKSDETVRYEFNRQGSATMFSRSNQKCFHGDGEVRPKQIVGSSSSVVENNQYQSLPPEYMRPQFDRHTSENSVFSSMPVQQYFERSPPHYTEQLSQTSPEPLPVHRVSTYPQNMNQYHGYLQPNRGRHQMHSFDGPQDYIASPVAHYYQQPHSYAGPHYHGRHMSDQSMRFTIPPPHSQLPHLMEAEGDLRSLSIKSDKTPTPPPLAEKGKVQHTIPTALAEASYPEVEGDNQSLTAKKNGNRKNESRFIPADEPVVIRVSQKNIDNESKLTQEDNFTESPSNVKKIEELQRRNDELENLIYQQRNEGCYKMDSSPVGICLLINNVEFKKNRKYEVHERRTNLNKNIQNSKDKHKLPRLDLNDRVGSNLDADKLERLFNNFDFEVQRHNDLDQRGILRVVTEVSSNDHSAYDCFLLIILSHGDNGCVFGVDGFSVDISTIQQKFVAQNCTSLADKPKIFIIQACQGTKAMPSVAPDSDIYHDGPQPENLINKSVPNKADFLVAYSTVPGFLSYRSRMSGTYFVKEIVEIFKKNYERQDLLSMMIMVNHEVGKYEHKQVPMPVPTLRKKVFFHLKEGCNFSEDEEVEETEFASNALEIQEVEVNNNTASCGGAVGGVGTASSVPKERVMQSMQESGEQDE